MKKMLSLVLAAMLVLSLFAGCGGSTTTTTAAAATTKAAETTKAADGTTAAATTEKAAEAVTVTGWGAWDFNAESTVTSYNEQLLWKAVAENTGVTFDWNTVAKTDKSALLSVAMSDSTSLADFFTDLTPLEAEEYGLKGALIDLSDYMTEEYMPNLCALMEKYPTLRASITSADGAIYYFPRVMALETRYWSGYFIREDMLETAGVEMPTTTDELYDALKAIKEKVDTVEYPMWYNMSSLKAMLSFFNVGGRGTGCSENDDMVVIDGELVYSPMEDNYREALKYFNKLYEDGLLNPDWNSLSGSDIRSAVVAKQAAMAEGSFSGVLTSYNSLLVADGQGEVLTYMNPLTGPQGTTTRQGHHLATDTGCASAISVTCENVEAIVKAVDWLYSEEGRDHVYWGEEGETYTIENGEHVFTEKVTSATMGVLNYLNSYSGNTSCYTSEMITEFYQSTLSDLAKEGNNEITKIGEANDIRMPALRFSEDEQKDLQLINADLQAYVDENFANFINGTLDVDDDAVWQKYIDGFEGVKVDDYKNIIATAYARYMENVK